MDKIQMVDLVGQYNKIKDEVDKGIQEVITSSAFINGPQVKIFEKNLAEFVGVKHCIACANGTDALQIAMMALDLKEGDEIIVPAFTYIATVETAALLGLKIVLADVDPKTFNLSPGEIEKKITPKTKAIIPVHLFGQCANMEEIRNLAVKHRLYIIEDNAQAIGAKYSFANGEKISSGAIGDIGTTSFFPSKNLGCYGDGGAIFTNNDALAEKLKMIVNHGQKKKYYHDIIGVNSRLDTIQAAILLVKLKQLDIYIKSRQEVAAFYDEKFKDNKNFIIPSRDPKSTHVFHQYTMILNDVNRESFMEYLQGKGIPAMVYYPEPVHFQKAYGYLGSKAGDFPISEELSGKVISLPIHTEMNSEQMSYIADNILSYFK